MTNTHKIVRNAISKELAQFLYEYLLLKRKVTRVLFDSQYIEQSNLDWGFWNDTTVLDTFSVYSDIALETLLTKVQPILEKETDTKLIPTYSYARIYKNGDVLERHSDRNSCEISCTLNLGGDSWSIYLEPDIEIKLKPSDLLIYKGCEVEHWRDKFQGDNYAQVFLHYNDALNSESEKNKFDTRPFLGLPASFKGEVYVQ
jgi:hypothetical protein